MSLFLMLGTAMAQNYSLTETGISSEELNAKTAPTLIAIKNLSNTNNYYFVGNTGAAPYSVAEFSDAAVFVWQPVQEGVAGSYYLMKLDGTYMQATSPKDFGTVDNAAEFTTTNPTTAGTGSSYFNGDGDSQSYIGDQTMLVRFVNAAGTWINVQNGDGGTPTYNDGKGGWTIHHVYAVEEAAVEPEPEPISGLVLELTSEQIGAYPYQLNEEDAAKVFALNDLTVAVKVNTPATMSGRAALLCTADPTQEANTSAEGTNSRYVAYGVSDAAIGYLASWEAGDRFTQGGVPAGANDTELVYVINPTNNTFKLYINGTLAREWVDANPAGFMAGYEIATPGMVKADHSAANIYIGGGVNAAGNAEVFTGEITDIKVFDGALTAEEIAMLFVDKEALAAARAAFEAAYANAQAMIADANLQVTKEKLPLQAGDANAAYYLWCNNPETTEGAIEYLFDGNTEAYSFFHTNWHGGGEEPHYIEVDLGEGNEVSSFEFGYVTRNNNGSDFPDAIQVMGSNDKAGEYTEVYNVSTGLPQGAALRWDSPSIASETAYRYIRFNVNAERTYWHMSEFDMHKIAVTIAEKYAAVKDAVLALNAAYEAHTNNTAYKAEQLTAAAEAINAAIEAVNAGITEPAPALAVVSQTPAADEAVTELSTITIEFSEEIAGTQNLMAMETIYVGSKTNACNFTVEGKVLTITLWTPITAAGEYALYVPAGVGITRASNGEAVVIDGEITFTVEAPAAPFEVVAVTPSEAVTELSTITVEFSEEIAGEQDLMAMETIYVGSRTNACNFTVDGKVLTITLWTPITAPGEYALKVPASVGITRASNGEAVVIDGEITFTVEAPAAPFEVVAVTPSEAVTELSTITVEFSEEIAGEQDLMAMETIYVGSRTNACNFTVDGKVLTITLWTPITAAGEYALYVPAGVGITRASNGEAVTVNGEIKFTVEEPAAEPEVQPTNATFDFTAPSTLDPVVTPSETASSGIEWDEITFTNNNVTVNLNKNTASNAVRLWTKTDNSTELRTYNGSTITITAPAGAKLKEIVFEGGKVSSMTADGFSGGTWTGEAQSVEFAVTGTLNVTAINVTLAIDGAATVTAPVASIESGVYTATQNVTFESEYANAENPSISYYYTTDGSDPTKESTLVEGSIEVSESCTIKVIAVMTVGEEEYTSDVATYEYIISEAINFVAATATEQVVAGKVLIIANGKAADAKDANYGYLPVRDVTVTEGAIDEAAYYAFELEAAEGGWYIKDNTGKYLYMTGSYNSFNMSETVPAEGGVWTIAIADDGTATITNVAMSKYVQYSTNYDSYGAYTEAQDGGVVPTLYIPYVEAPTLNETVVFDFVNGGWNIPTMEENNFSSIKTAGEYTDGTKTINIDPTANGGSYIYDNKGFLNISKPGTKIILPAFGFAVEKIEVVGHASATNYPNVDMNVFVGGTAVSTACIGSTETYTYEIAADNQAAGNVYELVIGSNGGNYSSVMYITYIKVYPAENKLEAPVIDLESGVYVGAQTVNVHSATADLNGVTNVTYYYTTDGNEPTVEDEETDGEITITESCTLKVIVELTYGDKTYVSASTSAEYIISEAVTYHRAVAVESGSYFIAANGHVATPLANNVLPAVETTINGDDLTEAAYYAITLEEAAEAGTYYIKDVNGNYIYTSSMYGTSGPKLSSNGAYVPMSSWTITVADDENSTATIVSEGLTLVYDTVAGVFKVTDSVSSDMILPTFYGTHATGIDGIYGDKLNGMNVNEGIYDLQGRKIETVTKGGIYIIDGKKVLVK